jgi:hypothetical protein
MFQLFPGGVEDFRDRNAFHTVKVSFRAGGSADVRTGPAGRHGVLDDSAQVVRGEESKLSCCRTEDRHEPAFAGGGQVHQSRIIADDQGAPVHRGGSLHECKLPGEIEDQSLRCKVQNLRTDLRASRRFGCRAKEQNACVQIFPQHRGGLCEALLQPLFCLMASRRAEANEEWWCIGSGCLEEPCGMQRGLLQDKDFGSLPVVGNSQGVRGFQVALRDSRGSAKPAVEVPFKVNEQPAGEFPFVDAPDVAHADGKKPAPQAAVDIEDHIVARGSDCTPVPVEVTERAPDGKFQKCGDMRVCSQELRVFRPGEIIDLTVRKPLAQ